MEIKQGISQMAEYPNMEINYVVPADGKMYYVLRDGELKNGAIIATLDPKRVVDENVLCDSMGVFKEDGSVLIDFNKKDIKKITDDLLLVVHGTPISNEVINAQKNRSDVTFNNMMKENQISIIDSMMREMGITGSILYSNPYEEANVYKIDSYNNKVGIESSFIGKTDKELFFHTNDINKGITRINYLNHNTNLVEQESIPTIDSIPIQNEIESIDSQEIKLDIGSDILEGFQKQPDTKEKKESTEDIIESSNTISENASNGSDIVIESIEDKTVPDTNPVIDSADSDENKDQVLDNVIAVMKKMIEETSKLNEKIDKLEKELEKKNLALQAQESKKNELSSLLTEANEVLENIDE